MELNGFTATHSVFHSEEEIDFSFSKFTSGALDLNNSVFLEVDLNFNHLHFGDGDFKFDNAYFHKGSASFLNAFFGNGVLSFINSKFNYDRKGSGAMGQRKKPPRNRSNRMLNFRSASFERGKIDFTRADLGSGAISFSNAVLNNRDLLFVSAKFNTARLTFKSSTFSNSKLDFRFSDFKHGDLLFDRADFKKGLIDFSATEFEGGKISFNRTEFEKNELIFESSEFENGKIIFKNNLFGAGTINFNSIQYLSSDILFENVDFGKFTASFLKSRINTLSFNSCHVNAYFNLHLQKCNALYLSNTVVRDIVDMKPYGFQPDIKLLNLSGLLLLGHFYIDWKTNKVKDLILNQQTTHRDRSEQFRILKENYHSLGQYDAEDEAYVEFRRSEAKADLEAAMNRKEVCRKNNCIHCPWFQMANLR